jgi:hypothetical protein
VRLNSRESRERVESGVAQERGRYEVASGFGAARLLDEPPREEPFEPWAQCCRIRELQLLSELDRGQALSLCDERKCDPLALRELVALVRLDEQLDHAGLHHAAWHGDVDGVGSLRDGRRLASARKQSLEEQIDTAALTLH